MSERVQALSVRLVLHGELAVAALKRSSTLPSSSLRPVCSPPAARRGRIEANSRRRRRRGNERVLHGELAVAALKQQVDSPAPRREGEVLHGELAVAALKRRLGPPHAPEGPRFSTASSPWPH